MTIPTPTELEIRGYVVQAFCDGVGAGVDTETSLVGAGIVDSAGVVQIVLFLEDRFGVKVDDLDVRLENFDTIAAMARLVGRLRGDAASPAT
jgi:acyl carrier protein